MSQSTLHIAVITPFAFNVTQIYLRQQFSDADYLSLLKENQLWKNII